ncbi:hypothetical protein M011DRAFT_336061 [Sporormia fimetaria CBS 119925]|uniref:Rhodopsin domain-containing protein n=1 Tax=Sporormia fimetaria CBS 119925 TaxID=1340428 RepID=A0A6A6VDP5_9PLEO|nr:hypothetical protein M011DRAFT_336061 [Sporormia fimetaria CBS 119925]
MPPTRDPFASMRQSIVAASVTRIVVSHIAVGLRFYSKAIQRPKSHPPKRRFFVHDAFVLLAAAATTATAGIFLWGLLLRFHGDVGKASKQFLLSVFVAGVLDNVTTTFIRLSILFFYRTIFTAHLGLSRIALGLIILSGIWGIGSLIGGLLACIPLSKFWYIGNGARGQCQNTRVTFLSLVTSEMVLDAAILATPLATLVRLNVGWRVRVGLVGIFSLGVFAVLTNALRLKYIYAPSGSNKALDIRLYTIWTSAHVTAAIVCACLPFYKPLIVGLATTLTPLWARVFPRPTKGSPGRETPSPEISFSRDGSREQDGISMTKFASSTRTDVV